MLVSFLFETIITFFACLTMAYVSMSISVGPWISPVIILICNLLFFKFRIYNLNIENKHVSLTMMQLSPSLGGIVCTAIGFTLPTLYFLDKSAFLDQLHHHQLQLFIGLGITTIFSCLWGFCIASLFTNRMTSSNDYQLPIPKLYWNIIKELDTSVETFFLKGFLSSLGILGILKILIYNQILKPSIHIFPSMTTIGFAMGKRILSSLICGLCLKFIVIPKVFFPQQPPSEISNILFLITASVICLDLLLSVILFAIKTLYKRFFYCQDEKPFKQSTLANLDIKSNYNATFGLLFLTTSIFFITYLTTKVYLLVTFSLITSLFTTYEIMKFSATIGLAPFGRFTTFVMVPAIILFSPNNTNLVNLCLFIAISGACAVNILFNVKLGQLQSIPVSKIYKHHIFSILMVSTLSVFAFWILLNNFELGSAQLFAQRGQSRAILVQAQNLDTMYVLFGAAILLFIKVFKLSEMMVVGALMMPLQLSSSMLLGAVLSIIVGKTSHTEFFFSGVFSGETIFMLSDLLLRLLWPFY